MDKHTIPGGTRKNAIQAVLQPTIVQRLHIRPLVHQVRGQVLWAVMKAIDKSDGVTTRYLSCSLLYRNKAGWTYQTFTEESFSNLYDCPIQYLDRAPVVNRDWRRRVREFHAQHVRRLRIDQQIRFVGSTLPFVTSESMMGKTMH